jgi:hypothetical protein
MKPEINYFCELSNQPVVLSRIAQTADYSSNFS